MNKQFYLFFLCFLGSKLVFGQVSQGARLSAMGNNGSAVKDIWGVEANPAAITGLKRPVLQANYEKHFFTDELSSQAIAFVFPNKRSSFGINLQRYGISEYQTVKAGIIITKQFSKNLSIGVRANYHQIRITTYGATVGLSIDVGATYQLNDALCFGIYINNPSKEVYNTKAIQTTIPTIFYLGMAYQTNDKLIIAGTLNKDFNAHWHTAIGIDYQLVKLFSIRSGLSLGPLKHHIGIGFKQVKFIADITFTRHPNFGYSPQITIGYVF